VVRRAVERLAEVLAGRGHEVIAAEVPYGPIGVTFLPRSLAGLREWARRVPDPDLLDPRTIAHIRAGRLLGGPVLALARAGEPLERIRIGRIFHRLDVVLAPTTASPPPRIGAMNLPDDWRTSRAIVAACPYTWPWNLLGWPAVNVPAGFTADGLPLGAQLLGPANGEGRLLSLAAELEDVERWHERTPPARADVSA
jgi:amidase